MKSEIIFVCKKYSWGWSVWMQGENFKKLLVSKLLSEYEVYKYIYSINNNGKYKVLA
jgi:hypothetical protein